MRKLRRVSIVTAMAVLLYWGWSLARPAGQGASVVTSTIAEAFEDGVVNPQTYASKSGAYQLVVDPSDRNGRFGALYVMTKDGETVWSGERPYTLLEVQVSDVGEVAGYAYSQGLHGGGARWGRGDFRVVILGPDGTARLDEAVARESSDFLHALPNPNATGVVLQENSDRVVFRIADEDLNEDHEEWWEYQLSTGAALDHVTPFDQIEDSQHLSFLIDARPVAGTPLILVQWWQYLSFFNSNKERSSIGTRFTLLNEDCQPVWNLDLAGDYDWPADEALEERLMYVVKQRGSILNTANPGQFEIYKASTAERITFAVTGMPGAWKIDQVGRQELGVEEFLELGSMRESEDIVLTPLQPIARLKLETQTVESPVRGVAHFTFDHHGRIGFIRHQHPALDQFVLVDEFGKVLTEIELDVDRLPDSHWSSCTWVSGDRFLVTRAGYEENRALAWWVDVASKSVTRIDDFESPPIESLVPFSDGGFVALATAHSKYTLTNGLYAFAGTGQRQWALDTDAGDGPTDLFSPEDIAVTPADQVAVIDNIRNVIQIFDRDGSFVRSVDLEKAWGRKPTYLTGIVAIPDGFLIRDFDGSPPYTIVDNEGQIQRGFHLSLDNGRRFIAADVAVAPDGSIWASDGEAIVRFDQQGTADRTLGVSPDANQLGKIAASTVDADGRIFLVDSRSAAVHIFDAQGRWQSVIRPNPDDLRSELFDSSLSVSDSGEIRLGVSFDSAGRFIQFSPTGERVRKIQLGVDSKWLLYQPGTDRSLGLTHEAAVLLDANLDVVKEIVRRPDGNWLNRPSRACFAPDGSFAVLDAGAVSLYDREGEPMRTIRLSSLVGRFPRLAYNGERIVLIGDDFVMIYDAGGKLLQASRFDSSGTAGEPHIVSERSEWILVPYNGTQLTRFALP